MEEAIDRALAEDVGPGDVTTKAVVPADARARARIELRAPGVVAGLRVAEAVFHRVDPELAWSALAADGDRREPGPVAEVEGRAASILTAERVALNFLGRLSGIATLTAEYVEAVGGTGARILDTRKTTPGLRSLEKEAVAAGGGHNHRFGLYDAVLVKENHVAFAGGVREATRRALERRPPDCPVEIECRTLADVEEALAAGARHLLLDNMAPDELRRAAELAGGRATLEASGGIRLEQLQEIAAAGIQFVSLGSLTHSAPALDLSMEIEPA